jgi:hypothetical protein
MFRLDDFGISLMLRIARKTRAWTGYDLRVQFLLVRTMFPLVFVSTVVLITAFWYLWPSPIEFPMDDTYIHFVYAQNLVEHGELMFNFPGETGIGATSLLWVVLLSVGYWVGFSLPFVAKMLGVFSLITLGVGLHYLLRPVVGFFLASIGSILVVVSGNMLWFALSGMETMLFLALGVVALILYRRKRWVWLGIVLGLITLTRPEGFLLAISIGMIEIWRERRIRQGIFIALLIGFTVSIPWYGYLFFRTGHFLPTSAVGKQLSMMVALKVILERFPYLAIFQHFPGILYPGIWLLFIIEFVLGGMALPPPIVPLGSIVDNPNYTFSIWAGLGIVFIVIPLLSRVFSRIRKWDRWRIWVSNEDRRIWIAFALWLVFHNLAYMAVLPVPGTASRYGSINHVALWVAIVLGYSLVKRNLYQGFLGISLIGIALVNTSYWNSVYDANLEHMINVRIPAAIYVRDHFSTSEKCAVYDVGAMRYFSQRRILDLGGLINPNLGNLFLNENLDQFLVNNDVKCIILPGRAGTLEDGWFDFAAELGFSNSSVLSLDQIAYFEIEQDRWLLGYLPTNNYQATVTVYQLVPRGNN